MANQYFVGVCPTCFHPKDVRSKQCRACSYKTPARGWAQDWRLHQTGYVIKSINRKLTYQHRFVMEAHLGRKLETWEHVHHKDGNRTNNQIQNLELISASQHAREHSGILKRIRGQTLQCINCLQFLPFTEFDKRKTRPLGLQGRCKLCRKKRPIANV